MRPAAGGTFRAVPQPPEPVRDLDWPPERARALAEGAVDLWEELLAGLRERPVTRAWREEEVRAAVEVDVPHEPLGDEAVLAYLRRLLLEQSVYLGHPGFLAYICGAGTVPGPVADLLAAAVNQNVGGWRISPGATEIELQCTRWLAARLGLPGTAGGHFVTGGAMANLIGLKAARDAVLPSAVEKGVDRPLAIYASEEAHAVIARAADMLGLGRGALRVVPVDERLRMRVDALEAMLDEDDAQPMAIVGTAGTTTTGAIDPLPALADLAAAHGAWFHVDAAYGGAAVLADDLRPLLAGIERADSLAIDPHKWLYVSTPCGCVLLRDHGRLGPSFAADASYIWMAEEARQGLDIAQTGPDFSRGFLALKVWLSLLAHGEAAYARRISHDAALARYLAELVEAHPNFELLCPPSLSICCFRFVSDGLSDVALHDLNQRLVTAVQGDGRVYCSNAVVHGRFGMRACIVNFRTEAEQMRLLLEVAAEHAARLVLDAPRRAS
jgi:aromatic-L-amino-acid/L-tryptophan decarboxylase